MGGDREERRKEEQRLRKCKGREGWRGRRGGERNRSEGHVGGGKGVEERENGKKLGGMQGEIGGEGVDDLERRHDDLSPWKLVQRREDRAEKAEEVQRKGGEGGVDEGQKNRERRTGEEEGAGEGTEGGKRRGKGRRKKMTRGGERRGEGTREEERDGEEGRGKGRRGERRRGKGRREKERGTEGEGRRGKEREPSRRGKGRREKERKGEEGEGQGRVPEAG